LIGWSEENFRGAKNIASLFDPALRLMVPNNRANDKEKSEFVAPKKSLAISAAFGFGVTSFEAKRTPDERYRLNIRRPMIITT
jgi:hypothetical protein